MEARPDAEEADADLDELAEEGKEEEEEEKEEELASFSWFRLPRLDDAGSASVRRDQPCGDDLVRTLPP